MVWTATAMAASDEGGDQGQDETVGDEGELECSAVPKASEGSPWH